MSILYPEKHTFLKQELIPDFNQRIINRVIERRLSNAGRKSKSTFPKLSSQIPVVYAPNVDVTRCKQAFGRWALPKLKRELHHPDLIVVMQSLNTISDLVHNPEKSFEAIRIGIVERLMDLMTHERDFIREKVCMIFYTLAGQEIGRRAIVRRYRILKNLAGLLEDKVDGIRHKASLTVDMLSRSPSGLNALNEANFPILLLRLIGGSPHAENEDILRSHLETLENLLRGNVKLLSLQHNALNILLEKIDHPREDISAPALSCISLLCWHPAGKEKVNEDGLVVDICKKLFHDDRKVNTKATSSAAFATVHAEVKKRAAVPCLMDRLLDLVEDFHSSEQQLMASKTLTNLAETPDGRDYLKNKKILKRIEDLYTNGDECVEKHKQILLDVIKWEP